MKKKISLLLFVLSVVIFLVYLVYTKGSFDYHIAQFLGYLFYWSIDLFILSLFALILDNKKYKIWLSITSVYFFISVILAYSVGDGNGAIISFDGKDLTWILSGLYSFISVIYFIIQYFKKK